MRWFVGRNGESFGPFSLDTLVNGARSGRLRRDDWIWRVGFDHWVSADSIADIWPQPNNILASAATFNPPVEIKPAEASTERRKILLVPFFLGLFTSILATIGLCLFKDWVLECAVFFYEVLRNVATFFNLK